MGRLRDSGILSVFAAIVHLDTSIEILVAFRDCDFSDSSDHNDCATPTRVSSLGTPGHPKRLIRSRKDKILWECANGGQLWTESVAAGVPDSGSIPSGFCGAGFNSLYIGFIISLLVDIVFQVNEIGICCALMG